MGLQKNMGKSLWRQKKGKRTWNWDDREGGRLLVIGN